MSDRDQLISMGFAADRVDWALRATQNKGLQQAMDHCLANSEKPVPDPATSKTGTGADDYDAEDQDALAAMLGNKGQAAHDEMVIGASEAKSIKCNECGKLLKSAAFASFHAEKSGHTDFAESTEEIKPLTEEEKAQKLQDMREKLAAKRAVQAKTDAQDAKANELIRRKAGQDIGELREEMQKKELIKEAEKRKAEAKADIDAKKRVREQIEADKRERAERTAREKALREGRLDAGDTAPVTVAKPMAAASASTANEARLRVRAPGGTWQGVLPATATLNDLEKKIIADGQAQGPLQFSSTFPRKQFTDKSKTLRDLGLVPNAALEAAASV